MNERSDLTPPQKTSRRRISRRMMLAGIGSLGLGTGAGYLSSRKRIRLAIIGAGTRGAQHASYLSTFSYFMSPVGEVVAICDVQPSKAKKLCNELWPKADSYQNYNDVLARPDVEAVMISTCDHWHAQIAIDAMRAGKAVYVEKPMTSTVEESFAVLKAQKETGATFQLGTQQRSMEPFRIAGQLLMNNRLGQLKEVTVTLDERKYKDVSCPGGFEAPADLDWDLWCGPTPLVPYCQRKYANSGWNHFFEYSGGEVTNWGSHHLDIALWATGNLSYPKYVDGKGALPQTESGPNVPSNFHVQLDYPSGLTFNLSAKKDSSRGILFEGDKGRIYANRAKVTGRPYEDLQKQPLPPDAAQLTSRSSGRYGKTAMLYHYLDFFRCIESGATPISDVESAHMVTTALHLSNISIRLGRPLEFDAATLKVVDDDEANSLLSPARRSPYLL